MDGWTWATLDDFIDLGELDELVAAAGEHAGAPALAFSVHDSDSVYLAGADASGIRFRLVVNPEAWEDELPPQDIDAAAAWSKKHAPLDPSPDDIAEVLARQFIFAEEGLDVLLAWMGLLPAEAGEGAEELNDARGAEFDFWSSLETVASPEERRLERGRWHASLQHADVKGHLLAADEEIERLVVDARVAPMSMSQVPEGSVAGYALRTNQPIVFLGQMSTRDDLWNELTRQGVTLGSWQEVPDNVARDLKSTANWVLSS